MYVYQDFSKADKKKIEPLIGLAVQTEIANFAKESFPMHRDLLEKTYEQHSLNSWYSLLILMGGALVLNQFQDWQYRNKILAQDETSKTYYWQIFGKTKRDINDLIYIDIDEKLPNSSTYKYQTVATYEIDTTSMYFSTKQGINGELQPPSREFAGTVHWKISEDSIGKYQNQWISICANLNLQGKRFNKYNAARLVCSVERNRKTIKWVSLRFQRIMPLNQWKKIEYFTQLPASLQAGDIVKVYLWNTSPDTLCFSQINVNTLLH